MKKIIFIATMLFFATNSYAIENNRINDFKNKIELSFEINNLTSAYHNICTLLLHTESGSMSYCSSWGAAKVARQIGSKVHEGDEVEVTVSKADSKGCRTVTYSIHPA